MLLTALSIAGLAILFIELIQPNPPRAWHQDDVSHDDILRAIDDGSLARGEFK
jgi:hypothetical protein